MQSRHKGVICIIISAFFFALMSLFVALAGDLPTMQKSFFRNAIAFLAAAVVLITQRPCLNITKQGYRDLLLRSLFGTIGILCNFYAVDHMLLADANILNKLSPFFAILMAALILGEKIHPFQLSATVGAFAGALLVIKPTNLVLALPALVGVLGGLCAGIAYTMVRVCGKQGIPGPFIVFFFSGFSCVVLIPFLLFDFCPMSIAQTISLLAAGCSAAIAQFAVTAAYTYAPARETAIFDYSQILFAALFGFIAFGQIPDILSWLGFGIILASAIANFVFNNYRANRSCV